MKDDQVIGICKLCRNNVVLVRSHVWPAFLYKLYIADQDKGGQFVDVTEEIPKSTAQLKRNWLCESCEGILSKSEDKVARLLRNFKKQNSESINYDEHLLRFAVSASWRTVQIHCENYNQDLIEYEWPAVKVWRKFLLGEQETIGQYTQHAFVLNDQSVGFHRMLSSSVHPDQTLVMTQAGSLLIIGLLERSGLSESESKIWEFSRIRPHKGSINRIKEWRVGRSVTLKFAQLLSEIQHKQISLTKKLARKWGWID